MFRRCFKQNRSYARTSLIRAAAGMAGAIALASGVSARAGVIASDSFETATSVADLTTGSGTGSGWAGAWDEQNSTIALANQNMTYDGGSVHVDGGNTALKISPLVQNNAVLALSRPFPSQTGTFYMSFLYQAPTTWDDDFFQFGLRDTVDAPLISGYTQSIATNQANDHTFYAGLNTFPNSTTDAGSIIIDNNATYFVVLKATKSGSNGDNYDELSLFINPTSNVEAEMTPVAHVSADSTIASVSQLIFRSARIDTGDHYYVDHFTLGTDFASVVPIPEPASLILLCLGGVMILPGRRAQERTR